MKVLIATPLYPPEVGGPATYSKFLFDNLPSSGIEVKVLKFSDIKHLPRWVRHFAYFLNVITNSFDADIIFAQDPLSVGVPSAVAAFILRKKFILKIVGDYAWEQSVQRFGVKELLDEFLAKKYSWRIEVFRKLQRFSAKRAKSIIVPSRYLKNVVKQWDIDPKKIFVIYNDVNLNDFTITKKGARQKLKIGEDDFILFSAGRLVPWKGFELLISLLPKIGRNAKLFVSGSGPDERKLRSLIEGTGSNTVLLGKLERGKVILYLRAADIFVLNTAYEGFSHQILESFALGVPTITTVCGGNKEIVKEGENALVAEYNKEDDWIKQIGRLAGDKVLAQKISQGAVKSIEDFKNVSMLNETVKFLKQV